MTKKFADGTQIAPHRHARDQLIYAVSGVMRISTSEDAWVVPPDRALLMPAGQVHGLELSGEVEMRTLYIAPVRSAGIKVLVVSALLRELISALAHEPIDYFGNHRAEQIATLIEIELSRAQALPLRLPLPQDPRLQKLCHRLLADPSIRLSLDKLADDSAASAKTLSRLCRRELGMGFSCWRRRVRFAKAFELLEQGVPVKRVAHACGYDSPSAFTHAFGKEFGTPPTAIGAP